MGPDGIARARVAAWPDVIAASARGLGRVRSDQMV